MDKMELQDVKGPRVRKALKGTRGLQDIPAVSPSRAILEYMALLERMGYPDNQEIKVCKVRQVDLASQALMDPRA